MQKENVRKTLLRIATKVATAILKTLLWRFLVFYKKTKRILVRNLRFKVNVIPDKKDIYSPDFSTVIIFVIEMIVK